MVMRAGEEGRDGVALPRTAKIKVCDAVSRYILPGVEETRSEVRQRSGGHRRGNSRRPPKLKMDFTLLSSTRIRMMHLQKSQ